jgi:hypothetical protein
LIPKKLRFDLQIQYRVGFGRVKDEQT